ncbi:MAG: nuclear transport factor 2 family protein [Candidatus Limnocylindria bacterium]
MVERLCRVTNEHDLQGVGACFATDYRLEMPTHPGRDFVRREQVLQNLGQIFAGVPDISVEARYIADGDTAWSGWEMRGTRRDGSRHLMRGAIIFRDRDGEFSAARFYVEPVEQVSVGVDEMIQQTVQVGTASLGPRQIAGATSAGPERAGQ